MTVSRKIRYLSFTAIIGLLTLAACSKQTPDTARAAVSLSPAAKAVFAASFDDLNGTLQPLKQWRGKVIVLNFWAPWCPPCRKEIPEFIQMQKQYRKQGLLFVGIAIDKKQPVQAFADETGMNYPVLLGGVKGVALSGAVGNRLGGLPYTLVIDRRGKIAATELGGLTRQKLERIVKPLL